MSLTETDAKNKLDAQMKLTHAEKQLADIQPADLKKHHDALAKYIDLIYSYTPVLTITEELLRDKNFPLILVALKQNKYLHSLEIINIVEIETALRPLLKQVLDTIIQNPSSHFTCLKIGKISGLVVLPPIRHPNIFELLLTLILTKKPTRIEFAKNSIKDVQYQTFLNILKQVKTSIKALIPPSSWGTIDNRDKNQDLYSLIAFLRHSYITQKPDIPKSHQEALVDKPSLSTSPILEELNLSNFIGTEKEFSELLSELTKASVKKLTLRMPVPELELDTFSTFLAGNTKLMSLTLTHCHTFAAVLKPLQANQECRLRELECDINSYDEESVAALCNFIQINATLEYLQVHNLTALPILLLLRSIKNNLRTALKIFCIDSKAQLYNDLEIIEAIVDLFKTNQTLKKAPFLTGALLSDIHLAQILKSILDNPDSAIDTLDLTGNQINSKTLQVLTALLQQGRIQDLNIDNDIGSTAYDPAAFNKLMASLRYNKSLQVLSFQQVVPPKSKTALNPYSLFQGLVNNPSTTLSTLKFSYDSRYQAEITRLLAINMTLCKLFLTIPSFNILSDTKSADDINKQIFDAIKQNPKSILREVYLYDESDRYKVYVPNFKANLNSSSTMPPQSTMSDCHFAKLDYFYSLIAPVISCQRTNSRHKDSIMTLLPEIFKGLQTSRPEPSQPAKTFLNAFMKSKFFKNEVKKSNNPTPNGNTFTKATVEEMQVDSQSDATTRDIPLSSFPSRKRKNRCQDRCVLS